MSTPLCKQPPITQISTSLKWEDINRDLENLFRALNRVMRCQSKMADAIDSSTGGSFGSGDGSTSGGSGFGIGTGSQNPDFSGNGVYRVSSGANVILPEGFSGYAMIDATANIDVTLPSPQSGKPITVMHTGTANTITLKTNAGTTIESLAIGYVAWCDPVEVAAGDAAWVTGTVVFNQGGVQITTSDFYFDSTGAGIVLKSPNGHYWRYTIDNTGATVTSDLGTTFSASAMSL